VAGWYQRADGTWAKVVQSQIQPPPTPLVSWYQRPDGSWDPVRVSGTRPTSPPVITVFDARGTIVVVSALNGVANKVGAAVTLTASGTIPVVTTTVGAATRTLQTLPAAGGIILTTTVVGNPTVAQHVFAASGTIAVVSGQSGNPARVPVVRAAVGTITLTTLLSGNPNVPTGTSTILIGCSDSPNDHGGTENWDGWRDYTKNARDQRLAKTGAQAVKYIAYSEGPTPFTTGVAATRQHVIDDLNAVYYIGGATSQTRNLQNWGKKIFWSNGNEMDDKGLLGPDGRAPGSVSNANLTAFQNSQQGLWEGCNFVDPTTGQRRFPDAYASVDPTQNHELDGIVEDWTSFGNVAMYIDHMFWSGYAQGRQFGNGSQPRWDWPSPLNTPSVRADAQQGNLMRCFFRTNEVRLRKRALLGPSADITIGIGEYGYPSDPTDNTARPYFIVYGAIGEVARLGVQFNMKVEHFTYWDNAKAGAQPHNILTDEPPNSDHGGTGTTNPTTTFALKNWKTLDYRQPGGAKHANWAANPKASWNQTGTPI
jgi:hypothetical protein